MSDRDVFLKVRELINNGWIQNTLAKNSLGVECDPTGDCGVCFCLLGAIYKAYYDIYRNNIKILAELTAKIESSVVRFTSKYFVKYNKTYFDITVWNDSFGRTKEDVLALIDSKMVEYELT